MSSVVWLLSISCSSWPLACLQNNQLLLGKNVLKMAAPIAGPRIGCDRLNPDRYRRHWAQSMYQFGQYRQREHIRPTESPLQDEWQHLQLPAPYLPRVFANEDNPDTWWMRQKDRQSSLTKIAGPRLNTKHRHYKIQDRLRKLTNHFNHHGWGQWTAHRILAKGGQGMAVHFRHNISNETQDIVLKMDLRAFWSTSLQDEKRATRVGGTHQVIARSGS